jgi:hypothetical protein
VTIFATWLEVRDRLLPAIERTHGTHDEDDILRGLLKGDYQLWAGKRAAIVSEIVTPENGKVKALHFFLVGGDLDELLEMEPRIAAWGKAQGCVRASCSGRKGWERVLGKLDYKLGCVFLYRDL